MYSFYNLKKMGIPSLSPVPPELSIMGWLYSTYTIIIIIIIYNDTMTL